MSAYYRQYATYLDISVPSQPVLWICTVAGDKNTSAWAQLGGGTGAAMVAITSVTGDYFTARPITVSFPAGVLNLTFGPALNIAKPNRQRFSVASELIDGLTVNYSAYTGNTRTANDGTNSEYQVCFPRYVSMTDLGFASYLTTPPTGSSALAFLNSLCVTKAIPIAGGTGVKDGGNAPILWEEIQSRVWARRYVQ